MAFKTYQFRVACKAWALLYSNNPPMPLVQIVTFINDPTNASFYMRYSDGTSITNTTVDELQSNLNALPTTIDYMLVTEAQF